MADRFENYIREMSPPPPQNDRNRREQEEAHRRLERQRAALRILEAEVLNQTRSVSNGNHKHY